MIYHLVVLTHGDSATLVESVASFVENVRPLPGSAYLHIDNGSPRAHAAVQELLPVYWDHHNTTYQEGFCASTRRSWEVASRQRWQDAWNDYVFWLEHDFVITEPINLVELGAVLDANPWLAQMALMRDAVNDDERAAGGLFESRPGQYEPRDVRMTHERDSLDILKIPTWHEHRSYLTTNPSLMRRAWMAENPWPDYESECEGLFGLDLVEKGHSFGVWGDGRPMTRHIGVRSGVGY